MKPNNPDIKPFLRQFYRGNAGYLFLAVLQTIFMTAANLLVSWLIQQIIDMIGGADTGCSFAEIIGFTVLGILLILIGCGFAYYSKPRFMAKAMFQYQDYVFSQLTQKGISAFSQEHTAAYLSALSNDVNSIETGYLANIFIIFDQMVMFCGALVLMFYYSPLLTFVSIGISLLPIAASLLTGGLVENAEKKVSDKNGSYVSTLRDALAGFSVIKSFRAEKQMCRIFSQDAKEVTDAKEHRRKMLVVVQTCANVAGSILQLGVFLFGAYLALSDSSISAGSVLIFVQLLNYVINPISIIPQALAECKASKALIAKLAEALASNVQEDGKNEKRTLQNKIAVEHLTFAYEENKPVLKDVSFTFEAGKSYCLVGASGSGKSTLLNLLMASHPGYCGSIHYDETELRSIQSEALYDMVSAIQQNVFLFNASIRDNITMFSDFPREAVDRAINLSGLSELIQERGENYLCGENGCGLSGGEKQRISIARSLLKNSQVLLADEVTVALDVQTAAQVSSAILNLTGLTRIVVTHSLEEGLLKRYDCILTLKNGAIAEAGSFEELMDRKGYFYSLFTVSQ